MGEAERVCALMPARQGAVFWPQDERGLVSICAEDQFPIETNSVDRILAIHAFQDFESADAVLRECWRMLTGQGRLVLIVPNRAGLWARADTTPFGHGAPWSMRQVRQALKDYMFVPERTERALFVPPADSRLLLATAPAWENLGQKFFNAFGGVNVVEAAKQLYAGIPLGAPATAARRRMAMPAALPVPERVKTFRE